MNFHIDSVINWHYFEKNTVQWKINQHFPNTLNKIYNIVRSFKLIKEVKNNYLKKKKPLMLIIYKNIRVVVIKQEKLNMLHGDTCI